MRADDRQDRRSFLGAAALAIAGARVGLLGTTGARAQSPLPDDPLPAFGPVRQIDAGVLNVGYVEMGPAAGKPVILLHGWPYGIHSYERVAPLLAARGHRVLVPYLRGHGTTRFLSGDTPRNGQQSALAVDVLAFMDAVKVDAAVLAGYDWGARTANIIGAIEPQRCLAMVSANGYLINNLPRNQMPLAPKAEHGWWYQFYFATDRGKAGYAANTLEFNRLMWANNSPAWRFTDGEYDRSAAAFANPDHVAIVIHNYRWRLSLASGESRYDDMERRLAAGPVIACPAITLDGDADGVTPATDGSGYAAKFVGRREHRVLRGVGHNLPQEAPAEFARAVMDVAAW